MNCFKQIEIFKDEYRENLPEPYPTWLPKVKRAVIWIHTHLFAQKLTVSWMKEQCWINGHNFSATFAYYLGQTPKQYILYHRIEAAKMLLDNDTLENISLSIIAIHLGFKSLASFDMSFKNIWVARQGNTAATKKYH